MPTNPVHLEAARLALAQLVPSALNPRRTFTPAADAELLESIQAHGILTPLLVRCIERDEQDTYEVVAGHRRLAAAQELGLDTVPVTIRELTDDQAREAAIIENLQREDLAPLDEATAYDQLLSRPGETPTTVAAAVGKSPAYIGRRLKLLALVPEAQTALREGALGVAHAELLTKLDAKTQTDALAEAVWMPMFRSDVMAEDRSANHLEPIAELREWVDKRTRLDLQDEEVLALFPEVDKLLASAPAVDGPPIEVALDRFGQSPAKATIPAGVLRLHAQFREVVGKRCGAVERAIVVFGQRKGDVILVCRDKKGCTTHWPPKVKADPADATRRPGMTWEEEEAERRRQHAIYERVEPSLRKAIVLATARVKTTPATLTDLLKLAYQDHTVEEAVKAAGVKVNAETVARLAAICDGFERCYNARGAAEAIKTLKVPFDLAKAMKDAEAAAAAKTGAPKTAKKGRAA